MQGTRNYPVDLKRITGLGEQGEGTKSKNNKCPLVHLKFTQLLEHPVLASNFARAGGGGAGPGPGEAAVSYRFGPEMRFCSD